MSDLNKDIRHNEHQHSLLKGQIRSSDTRCLVPVQWTVGLVTASGQFHLPQMFKWVNTIITPEGSKKELKDQTSRTNVSSCSPLTSIIIPLNVFPHSDLWAFGLEENTKL